MNLGDFEITPGIIVDVNDPEHKGRVKCAAAGLFNPDTVDKEVLPWIMPIMMNKYQMFSKPVQNSKVWILNNKENHNEFWYVNFFEMTDVTDTVVNQKYDNDLELIMSRKTLDDSAQMSYDTEEGIIIKINNNKINIQPNGDIYITGGSAKVNIIGGTVYIGAEGGADEPAVMGEQLVNLLKGMLSAAAKLEGLASGGEIAALKPGFTKLKEAISENINKIKAEHTKVN